MKIIVVNLAAHYSILYENYTEIFRKIIDVNLATYSPSIFYEDYKAFVYFTMCLIT